MNDEQAEKIENMNKVKFIPGLKLSELFFIEVVNQLIKAEYPGLKYSAGLIDYGSEVLGFDTVRSTDHHWGPRFQLFLLPEDISRKKKILKLFSKKLPSSFHGYSTHFSFPDKEGVQLLEKPETGQLINHRIEIHTVRSFFQGYLSIDPDKALTVHDWLTLSEQKLRTIRSGKIFFDQIGLKNIQKKLHYFPEDAWLYMLASEWMKISQEEPFVGRCSEAKDEIGSKIIAARLVQTIMRLCFLMEREYAPYSKWFGTAFLKLRSAKELSPVLNRVLASGNFKEREKYLSQAYRIIIRIHNGLKLTRLLPSETSNFYGRPFKVIHGKRVAVELKKIIKDPVVKKISADIGSINQLSNTVDLLENDGLLKKLKVLYK